jgi:hypothetical protein
VYERSRSAAFDKPYVQKFYKFCTFNAICKDNIAINCITVQHKKGFIPVKFDGSYPSININALEGKLTNNIIRWYEIVLKRNRRESQKGSEHERKRKTHKRETKIKCEQQVRKDVTRKKERNNMGKNSEKGTVGRHTDGEVWLSDDCCIMGRIRKLSW